MGKKVTRESCLAWFNSKHGDKYDYSEFINYEGAKQKINIKCNDCGNRFSQSITNHKSGKGCPNCSGARKITTEIFVSECENMNPGQFIYDRCDYKSLKSKVELYCNLCGQYRMIPPATIYKGGSCICQHGLKISKSKTSSQSEFIEKAIKLHGDKFRYDKVKYNRSNETVLIGCNGCDSYFTIRPNNLLTGKGCPNCAKNKPLTTCEFYKRAKHHHGERYEYIDINHKENNDYISYLCPKHGEVIQNIWNHLKGTGCPTCASGNAISNLKLSENIKGTKQGDKPCILYHVIFENKVTGANFDKIGITVRSTKERYISANHDGFNYTIIREEKSTLYDCLVKEDAIKQYLIDSDLCYRVHDLKNTRIGGWTECFINTPEVQEKIDEIFNSIKTQHVII